MTTTLLALLGAGLLDAIEELFHWFRRDTTRFWRMIEMIATPWIGSPTYYWRKTNGASDVQAATEALETVQSLTTDDFAKLTTEPYHHAAHRHTAEAERQYTPAHVEHWRDA